MNKNFMTKAIALAMAGTMALSLTACSQEPVSSSKDESSTSSVADASSKEESKPEATPEVKDEAPAIPKYVFMFIGDGMSHVQTQLSNYYLDALTQDTDAALDQEAILKSEKQLSFMNYESIGVTTTYDSTSFAPDSASTATSLATGKKTYSGTINMDETFTTPYETIAEKAKKQLGYKVGVVSSVTLNHATPAAYYAHNESRNNYYDIALEIADSNFDYFGGGALNKPNGKDGDQENIYDVLSDAGYKVVLEDQKAAEAVTAKDGKVLIVGEDTNGGALPYENDREDGMWALADYVSKGIEVLDNDKGFFMMVEAGKIDWACHANDAKSAISDTIAFDNAIQEAYDFYEEHPEETLIIVTGDHETGGMTIGFAGTKYDTFLQLLEGQQGSYDAFEANYTANYVAGETTIDDVLADVETFFGLSKDAEGQLALTDYEISKIEEAFEITVNGDEIDKQKHNEIYGGYDPLTVTLVHIMNNKSGVDFTSFSHTGVTVGTYAQGVGSERFGDFHDNIDIFANTAELLGVK